MNFMDLLISLKKLNSTQFYFLIFTPIECANIFNFLLRDTNLFSSDYNVRVCVLERERERERERGGFTCEDKNYSRFSTKHI